jgi:hypothetical protein
MRSVKRMKHRGSVPKVDSCKTPKGQGDRLIGDYVLHPTKGWRKVSSVNVLSYQNVIIQLLSKAVQNFKLNGRNK